MIEEKAGYKKKLIEVTMPLDIINLASAREKSLRHGNISTMHLWWSRKPICAAKAVIFASLIDDPGNYLPPKSAEKERKKLFKLISDIVQWKNPNQKDVNEKIKEELSKSIKGKLPPILDPFCGGGSIPLAAQLLGLDAYGGDLNPVAVLISKALVEIPTSFQNKKPVNPDSRLLELNWTGLNGVANDIRYYGKWINDAAYKKIGHLYPKTTQGKTVIAWIWYRTVECPNPACKVQTPLTSTWLLVNVKNKKIWNEACYNKLTKNFEYQPRNSGQPKIGTVNRNGAKCLACNSTLSFDYICEQGRNNKIFSQLGCTVVEGNREKLYLSPDLKVQDILKTLYKPEILETNLPEKALGFRVQRYGMVKHRDLFSTRQLVLMKTLVDLVDEVKSQIEKDASKHFSNSEDIKKYSTAIVTYLAIIVSKCADYYNQLCCWNTGRETIEHLFGRQAIPMVWNYTEANPFSHSSKNFLSAVNLTAEAIENIDVHNKGLIKNLDATRNLDFEGIKPMISTDPPYYDNIGYADLSDFFYVWMRLMLSKYYPDLFSTMLTPKKQELVATPFRFDSKEDAKKFFTEGINRSFVAMKNKMDPDYPLTIYYAFKQSEKEDEELGDIKTSSTGWDTMLTGLINAGFQIMGTWPLRTERSARPVSIGTNALASSIILVCRPKDESSPLATRREFINNLKKELPYALKNLQDVGIAPVDMAQCAIGPGMAVFSRYSKVLEANGTPMDVKTALQIINQELDSYFSEQDADMDKETRFCIAWFEQFGWKDAPFGIAEGLMKAQNTAINGLEAAGIVVAKAGKVRLIKRSELADDWDPRTDKKLTVWECVNYLIKILEDKGEEGAAEILRKIGGLSEPVKELAYRLYALCDKKGWAEDGLAFNNIISSWQSITDRAQFGTKTSESTKRKLKDKEQRTLFDL